MAASTSWGAQRSHIGVCRKETRRRYVGNELFGALRNADAVIELAADECAESAALARILLDAVEDHQK